MSTAKVQRLEKIDDGRIAGEFEYQIRGEIFQIAMANYSQFDSLPRKEELRAGTQRQIIGKVNEGMNPDTRARVLAQGLFDTLDAQILSKHCFGLDAVDDGITEEGLRSFEKSLENNKEIEKYRYLEWRANTATHVRQMGQDQPSPRPAMIAKMICIAMLPCLKKTTEQNAVELAKRWIKVCEEAFQFSLNLRREKALYKCEYPDATRYDQDTMEKWGVVPLETGRKKVDLAFFIMPSFVKCDFAPESSEARKKILVKAQVYVYGDE